MTDQMNHWCGCRVSRFGVMLACVLLFGSAMAAWSQAAPQPVAQQSSAPQPSAPQGEPATAPPPAAQPAPENPGLIEEISKLLRNSASGLSSSLKGSQETIENFNARATDHLRVSPQTVVNGRATCPAAANGAPDCKAASDHLCKAKGYKEGKSLDIESAEKCSAKVYLSGRTGTPGECTMEHYVTRAVCQ